MSRRRLRSPVDAFYCFVGISSEHVSSGRVLLPLIGLADKIAAMALGIIAITIVTPGGSGGMTTTASSFDTAGRLA
jgi:hypothetical protein